MEEPRTGLQDLLTKLVKDTFSSHWDDGINHEHSLSVQDIEDIRYHYERLSGRSWMNVSEEIKEWAFKTYPLHELADHDQAAYHIHTEWIERLCASLDKPA